MAAIEESGIPVVDNFICGEPFCVLDNYTLYKLPAPVDRTSVPSTVWDELASLLEDRMPDKRALWVVVHYSPLGAVAVSHTAIFDTLAERLLRFDVAFAVGEADALNRVVLIRKKCFKALPDFSITCMSHKVLRFAKGNNTTYKKVVNTFSNCCVSSRSNLHIQAAAQGALSFEQIMASTARLDVAGLRELRATIIAKDKADRTDHDRAVLRSLPNIVGVRKAREPLGDSSLFWKVNKPPMNIAPQRFFKTDYTHVAEDGTQSTKKMFGRRLLEQAEDGSQPYIECDLDYLLDHPELLTEHAVVFMGGDSTTGYGKSTIARFLACKFAVYMTRVLNRPKTDATVVNSTTLDDLSTISCKSGWAVMLDELAVGDPEAVQYMCTTMMKAMCDPMTTTSLRARGKNVVLAANSARIFTTNATSLEDWAAGRFVMTLPVKRKMWVFVITHKMIEHEWAKRDDYVGSELF